MMQSHYEFTLFTYLMQFGILFKEPKIHYCWPLMLNIIFLFSLTYSYKDKQMDVLDYPMNFNVFHCVVKFFIFIL